MKRYSNLFDVCFSTRNILDAYLEARKGKRYKKGCFDFERNLGTNIADLKSELYNNIYKLKPYYYFTILENKPREICAPSFRDVVIQHAIYRIIYPIFDRSFIDTSFACRKNKGTHKCSDYVQNSMRLYSDDLYTLHLDVKKFFYSINQNILFDLIQLKIKDNKLLNIIKLFINYKDNIGIPIGNLLSQLYALIYLNPVDHYIKRELKVKHYCRYVDDLLLIGITFEEAKLFKKEIESFLNNKLYLSLSKYSIKKIKQGVNFVGYRTWKHKRLIRKYSLYKFNRKLKQNKINSVVSLLGHAKKTNTYKFLCNKILSESPSFFLTYFDVFREKTNGWKNI